MSKVKKISHGDKVRCINNSGCSAISEGNIYTVSGTVVEEKIRIGEFPMYNGNSYNIDRFILASEPWYVMAWDVHENQAVKVELVKDLTDNKAVKGPSIAAIKDGLITTFRHKSDIKNWRSRNVVFTNSYGEDVIKDSKVWFVRKADLSILKVVNLLSRENCIESEVYTEAMSKERAEAYIEEHTPKHVQFSDEEMYNLVGKTVDSNLGRYMITGCKESKGMTWALLGNDPKHMCHSGDLLNSYVFTDTKEPVGKLTSKPKTDE